MQRHRRSKEWFDEEAIWRESFPFIFPESRFAAADETIDKVLALTNTRGKTALDLCCGPGRCSVALSKRGFSVTGVDRTKYLLDKARARARRAKVRVEWLREDMRDFVRPESYDLAVSMFTSFGYFEKQAEDMLVLSNVFRSLRPGGVFVLEMMGKETLARSFRPSSVDSLPDGSMLVEQRQILDGWARVRNAWTIVRKGRSQQFEWVLNLYSGQELRQSLQAAGFVDIKLYGNFNGEAYGADAQRLIAAAWKL